MTSVLSPQNASLLRLARRSIRRDWKRSFAVFALVGAPIGLLTSFVFGTLFRVSAFDDRFDDSFVIVIAAFVPLVVGTVIIAVFVTSVRRRTRDLGQLFVVGASGSQLRRLVLMEASVLTVAGAVAFSLLGMVVVFLRQPNGESLRLVLGQERAFILLIPLLFGIGVAQLAALLPAWRAGSVSPIAALNARVPETNQRWWPLAVAVALFLGLLVWRSDSSRIEESSDYFVWGVAAVWVGFAVVAALLPRVVRRVSLQADRLPGVARLAVRDSGRSVARASSLAAVAVAVSTLGVMSVAGLESDRGVYDVMDAHYITTPLDGDLVAADGEVERLIALRAVVDFDDLRQVDRDGRDYGPTYVAALTDEAIAAFGLSGDVVASIPEGGAVVLDGQDWPLLWYDGEVIPAVVVDAGVGDQSGGGAALPTALMRPSDVAMLPFFYGSEGRSAEEVAEQAALYNPAVRLYVAEEPLSGSLLNDMRTGQSTSAASLGVTAIDDRYFGFSLEEFLPLLIAISLGVIVVSALGLTKLGAREADAALQPMVDMGASPSIRRTFLALQTGTLVLIGGVLGSGLGVVLFWVVTRGDRTVPDPIVPWSAIMILTLGAAALSAGFVAILFGPKASRTRASL